jgi:hypothetical protein
VQNLRSLQKQFKSVVQHALNPSGQVRWVRNTPPVPTLERISVYRNAYRIRLVESMEEDFPEVLQILGQSEFEKLTFAYLDRYPSRYWTLARVGENFARFIRSSTWVEQFPYLADLAKFEWLHIECSRALLSPPADFSHFSKIPIQEQMGMSLVLGRTVRFFSAPWDIPHLIESGQPVFQSVRTVIYQSKSSIHHQILSRGEWNFLRKIQRTQTIESLLNSLSDSDTLRFSQWLADWTREGIISGYCSPNL